MDLMERKAIEDAALAKALRERDEREHEMELQEIQLSDHELYERHMADYLFEREGDR